MFKVMNICTGVIVTKHKPPAPPDNTSFRTRARVSVCRGWLLTSWGVSTAPGTRGTVTLVSASADTWPRVTRVRGSSPARARVSRCRWWTRATRAPCPGGAWPPTRCTSWTWSSWASSSSSWSSASTGSHAELTNNSAEFRLQIFPHNLAI